MLAPGQPAALAVDGTHGNACCAGCALQHGGQGGGPHRCPRRRDPRLHRCLVGGAALGWVGLPWGGRAKGEACHVGAMEGGCCSSSAGDVGRWRLAHAEPCGASDWAAGMAGIYCRPGFPASWRSRAARDKAPSARPLPGTRGVWARVAQRVAGAAPPTPATLAGYHPPTLLFC